VKQRDDLSNSSLTKPMIYLMPVAMGVIVANLYYLQPLLHQVRSDFAIGTVATASLITLVQFGYAAGLTFVVPLGDIFPRRRLVVTIFVLAATTMVLGSLVHSYVLFGLLTVLIGLTSVGGQVMLPLAAHLADPEQRGRVIARLMSGLLIGVLLSRTFSGIGAEAVGWRGVYVIAAVVLLVMAFLLSRILPDEPKREHVKYWALVGGSFRLLGEYRVLRRRAWFGANIFASFSILWSTLAFQLSGAPFHYSNVEIGLFGLLGVGGVLAANTAGHLADRGRIRAATIGMALIIAVSFALMWLGRHDVWILALSIFTLDAGAQGMQITNQSVIYGLAPEKNSRITSAYMVCCFTGAAIGSLAAGFAYAHDGWAGVCWLGLVIAVLTVVPAVAWHPPVKSAG
jgi:predicted MFS family arabinose efflux permease